MLLLKSHVKGSTAVLKTGKVRVTGDYENKKHKTETPPKAKLKHKDGIIVDQFTDSKNRTHTLEKSPSGKFWVYGVTSWVAPLSKRWDRDSARAEGTLMSSGPDESRIRKNFEEAKKDYSSHKIEQKSKLSEFGETVKKLKESRTRKKKQSRKEREFHALMARRQLEEKREKEDREREKEKENKKNTGDIYLNPVRHPTDIEDITEWIKPDNPIRNVTGTRYKYKGKPVYEFEKEVLFPDGKSRRVIFIKTEQGGETLWTSHVGWKGYIPLIKSHIRAHQSRTKSGKVVQVKDYDDRRRKKTDDPKKQRGAKEEDTGPRYTGPSVLDAQMKKPDEKGKHGDRHRNADKAEKKNYTGKPKQKVETEISREERPQGDNKIPHIDVENKSFEELLVDPAVLDAEEKLSHMGEETINDNSPERQALRIRKAIEYYGTGAARKEHKIHLVLGPPASGKSFMSDKYVKELGAKLLDSDEVKAMFDEFAGGAGANRVHEESKQVLDKVMAVALSEGDNIVHPIVGGNPKKVVDLINRLKSHGYSVSVTTVDLPIETTLRRALSRYEKTGRYISPSYIVDEVGAGPMRTHQHLVENGIGDSHEIISTDVPRGENPRSVQDFGRTLEERQAEESSLRQRRSGVERARHAGEAGEGAPVKKARKGIANPFLLILR